MKRVVLLLIITMITTSFAFTGKIFTTKVNFTSDSQPLMSLRAKMMSQCWVRNNLLLFLVMMDIIIVEITANTKIINFKLFLQLECLKKNNCAGYAYKADENMSCLILSDITEPTQVSSTNWTLYIKSES